MGLLRIPHSVACSTEGTQTVDVDSRDYILLGPPSFSQYFPGRKLLFDIGTGTSYQSSMQWLIEHYEQQRVVFDEIWCWEAQQVQAHEYWASVPVSLMAKVHFYNTYATVGSNGSSPIVVIKQMHRPGDFVAVKLNIDNEEIEDIIMGQLFDHADLVNEVFFEKHFDAPEMQPWFGKLQTSLNDTLSFFRQYRSAGMRLHYWP